MVGYMFSRGIADDLLAKSNYLDGEQKEMCRTHSKFVLAIGDRAFANGGINGDHDLSAAEEAKYQAAKSFNDGLPSVKELEQATKKA
jgi:hypothetical protein